MDIDPEVFLKYRVDCFRKELATPKELDRAYEANPTEGEHEAYRLRRQRHDEITSEIKGLAKRSRR